MSRLPPDPFVVRQIKPNHALSLSAAERLLVDDTLRRCRGTTWTDFNRNAIDYTTPVGRAADSLQAVQALMIAATIVSLSDRARQAAIAEAADNMLFDVIHGDTSTSEEFVHDFNNISLRRFFTQARRKQNHPLLPNISLDKRVTTTMDEKFAQTLTCLIALTHQNNILSAAHYAKSKTQPMLQGYEDIYRI